jgi:hypothetical protein
MSERVAIGRPIEGISLNGLEYVLDGPAGAIMWFDTEDIARDWIEAQGVDPDADDIIYVNEDEFNA